MGLTPKPPSLPHTRTHTRTPPPRLCRGAKAVATVTSCSRHHVPHGRRDFLFCFANGTIYFQSRSRRTLSELGQVCARTCVSKKIVLALQVLPRIAGSWMEKFCLCRRPRRCRRWQRGRRTFCQRGKAAASLRFKRDPSQLNSCGMYSTSVASNQGCCRKFHQAQTYIYIF